MPARAALLHQLARIEAEKDALLAELDHCSPTRSEAVPYTGGWTVAQVITHLAVIEEGAVAYLNKKLEFKKHRPLPITTALRFVLLQAGIQLPVKYKAPAVVADIPATSYAVARARWCAAREELIRAYTSLPDGFLTHDLFKHPFMGRFNVVQAVRFIRRHARRHCGQVDRTLAALG